MSRVRVYQSHWEPAVECQYKILIEWYWHSRQKVVAAGDDKVRAALLFNDLSKAADADQIRRILLVDCDAHTPKRTVASWPETGV